MENISVNKAIEAEDEIVEGQETEALEDQEEASEGLEGEEGTEADDEETEITLDGDDGSQPDRITQIVRKRVNRLNKKVSRLEEDGEAASSELIAEREKNKLLRLALDQKNEANTPKGPPDPLDFDGGASDAKYIEALDSHNQEYVRAALEKHIPKPEVTIDRDLEVKQTLHYEAADKLKLKDYDDVEDVALSALGKETVNQIIQKTTNSPVILYHLGKNPEKAERIADLLKADPVKGVMELGALEAKLKVTKVKRNQAPDPDSELEGSTSPHNGKRGKAGATFE